MGVMTFVHINAKYSIEAPNYGHVVSSVKRDGIYQENA